MATHRSSRFFSRAVVAVATVMMIVPPVSAQSDTAEDYTVKTAPALDALQEEFKLVPKDELELMLAPLTKEELKVEAEAWMALLKAKVREISAAELAIKRKNREIKATKQTAAAIEKAQKAAEKAADAKEQAEVTGDEKTTAEAEKAAKKAEEAAKKAEAAAEEAKEAEEETVADEEVVAATEAAQQRAEEKAQAKAEEAAAAAAASPAGTPEHTGDADNEPDAAAEEAEEAKVAAETKVGDKAVVLDLANELRDQRSALVDRMNVVLAELKKKGGEVEEYETYVAAVSGIRVDVTDTMAAWATVKGWLTSSEGGIRWGVNVVKFIAIAGAFWILSLIVGRVTQQGLKVSKNLSFLLREFIAKMASRLTLAVGLIVALSALEVNVGPLLAVIGAAGFVVAFALQDTLSNFASGIMILMYRPFDVGDIVDAGGVSGKAASLNLMSVTIRTFDNKVIIVPNNAVWNGVITNWTGEKKRRVDMQFGIGYGDDIDKAQRILEEIVENHPLVLKDPEPIIKLNELGESSVNFVVRPWCRTDDYWTVYWDITRAVKEQFDANGVSIPFPQRDVHVHPSAPKDDSEGASTPATASFEG